MEIETIVFGGIALLVSYFLLNNSSSDDKDTNSKKKKALNVENRDIGDRIPDEDVTIKLVKNHLKKIPLHKSEKLKTGYTENSIQVQMHKYLREEFESVQREYGLEGNNAMKIDFNIGRGRVGIEVKLARSVFKTAGLQRLVGQLKDYSESKYDNDNLIVAVIGEKEFLHERVQLTKIKDRVKGESAHFLFLEIDA